MTVVNASSVYANDNEKWGPQHALTDISINRTNYWHSAADDINPSIIFKMQHEHEVLAVDVVDRLNGYNERFQSVEVRVGTSLSFNEAQSCGIQSYEGEKSYRLVYFVKQCMQNVDKMYIQTFPFLRYFCSNLKGELDRGSIRSSPRDGLSTPYR